MSHDFYEYLSKQIVSYSCNRLYKVEANPDIYFQNLDQVIIYFVKKLPNTLYSPEDGLIFFNPDTIFSIPYPIKSFLFEEANLEINFSLYLTDGILKLKFDDDHENDFDEIGEVRDKNKGHESHPFLTSSRLTEEFETLLVLSKKMNENHPILQRYRNFKTDCYLPRTSITITVVNLYEFELCISKRVTLIYNVKFEELYWKSSIFSKIPLSLKVLETLLCFDFEINLVNKGTLLREINIFHFLKSTEEKYSQVIKYYEKALENEKWNQSFSLFLVMINKINYLYHKIPLISTKTNESETTLKEKLNEIYCCIIKKLPGGQTKGLKEDGIDKLWC